MKVSFYVALVLSILFTGCFKGEGQVRIDTNVESATIYIDGDKKGMTGDGYTTIVLKEGDYKVRIYKEIDEEWYREGTQDIFVGAKSSVKVKIDTEKKPTEKRLERLAKEKKAEEERLAREKKEREERIAREKEKREVEKQKKQAWLNKHQKSGVFADYSTKLIWQDDYKAQTTKEPWVRQSNYDTKNYMNTSGDTATTHCSNLSHAGYSDWRLPAKSELEDLYRKKSELKNINFSYYWSSATYEGSKDTAWFVNFYNGNVDSNYKYTNYFVRCVRAEQ